MPGKPPIGRARAAERGPAVVEQQKRAYARPRAALQDNPPPPPRAATPPADADDRRDAGA